MRYSSSEKMEIITLVEQSHLPLKRTLAQLNIPRSTWYNWYNRYLEDGIDALQDRKPIPKSVWNKIPASIKSRIVKLALEEPELSPRELAVTFAERENYYISEASVYRILKAQGLITSPAFILMKAADKFQNPTTAVNQLWQTDFTYLKVIGWGWLYLSTVLDDYSRYIVAWKLCTGMTSKDVSDTLHLALKQTGFDRRAVRNRPRLLSDNGPSYVSTELAGWLEEQGLSHTRGKPYHLETCKNRGRYRSSSRNYLIEVQQLPDFALFRRFDIVELFVGRKQIY